MVRRKRPAAGQRELLQRAGGASTTAFYGLGLGVPDGMRAYEDLVELAAQLGMPAPPDPEAFAINDPLADTPRDVWERESGLYHAAGQWCPERAGHWAFQCRG